MPTVFTFTFWQRRFLAVPVFRPGNFGRGTFQLDIELVRRRSVLSPARYPKCASAAALVGFFQSIYLREKSANLPKCVVLASPGGSLRAVSNSFAAISSSSCSRADFISSH